MKAFETAVPRPRRPNPGLVAGVDGRLAARRPVGSHRRRQPPAGGRFRNNSRVVLGSGSNDMFDPRGGWHAHIHRLAGTSTQKTAWPVVRVRLPNRRPLHKHPRSWRPEHISKNEPKPAGLYLPLWRPPAGAGGWNPQVMPNALYEAVMAVLGQTSERPRHRTEGDGGGWDLGTRTAG